ncbi:MAG: DUF4124 domain-containing protein [Candidatus Sedimenticola endophacoides]
MSTSKHSLAILLGLILCAAPDHSEASKLYRWVDDEGTVHYTDQVPPEQSRRARTQLNERGMEVVHTEKARTPEQILQEQELQRLRAKQERLRAEQRAKDQVLLRTFRTEEDIRHALEGKLTAVDVMIQITRSNIRRAKVKLSEMQGDAATLERQGRPVSPQLQGNIETTREQIQEGYDTILGLEQQKSAISAKFTADQERFRILKNLKHETQQGMAGAGRPNLLLQTLVPCADEGACAAAWEHAEQYVRIHATTRIQMLSETVIISAPPLKDDDISLTVSRLADGEGAKIFLDLQCKGSPLGEQLCASERAQEIRSGFPARAHPRE